MSMRHLMTHDLMLKSLLTVSEQGLQTVLPLFSL